MHVQVCRFANATCGEFEALQDRGYLQTAIRNTGYIPSSYTLSVLEFPAHACHLP